MRELVALSAVRLNCSSLSARAAKSLDTSRTTAGQQDGRPSLPVGSGHWSPSSTIRERSAGVFRRVSARPVSSSMVMNMTPLADPGFCRTSTSPAV